MQRTAISRTLLRVKPARFKPFPCHQLHTTSAQKTDGVYKALTEMRVRIPWIEALRKQREEGNGPATSPSSLSHPSDRGLKAKKMSDSFHKVVCIFNVRGVCLTA